MGGDGQKSMGDARRIREVVKFWFIFSSPSGLKKEIEDLTKENQNQKID